MKKSILAAVLIFLIIAHQPLSYMAMVIVDIVGQITGINVVEVIDFLNTIYYF